MILGYFPGPGGRMAGPPAEPADEFRDADAIVLEAGEPYASREWALARAERLARRVAVLETVAEAADRLVTLKRIGVSHRTLDDTIAAWEALDAALSAAGAEEA